MDGALLAHGFVGGVLEIDARMLRLDGGEAFVHGAVEQLGEDGVLLGEPGVMFDARQSVGRMATDQRSKEVDVAPKMGDRIQRRVVLET